VEIPFPHVTVYMGEDKDGKAPQLRIEGGAPVRDGAAAPEPAAPEPAANHGKDTSA
jgi:small conductance mechanosensitive channel